MTTLEDVLSDARGDAKVLRRAGNGGQADYIEALCDRIAGAGEDYLRKLTMADARLKSGLSERTLRRRFRQLEDCGLAERDPRRGMVFRACAIPQRPAIAEQRQRGRDAARSQRV